MCFKFFLFILMSNFIMADVRIEPNCDNDKVKQEARSNELQRLVNEDQRANRLA